MADVKAASIKMLLTEVVNRGATDLHLSVGNNPALRINGELVILEDIDLITQEFMTELINTMLDKEKQDQLSTEREIILTRDFDKNMRFKINIFYQRDFLSATLRYIPKQAPTIDSLGLNPIFKKFIDYEKGLIIISGSFGSGRSTTVAAIIEEINQSRRNYIITIEDPIEYVFTNKKSIIEQREIGRDTKSFIDALNYFEEEDGDVLFLEEMQDPKIIPMVLEIARGSSLVLSSMSASSSTNTISRILDSFQSFDQERIRNLLSTSLKAIVCQKMVPKIGGGEMAIQEVMIVNDAIKSIIASGNISQIHNIIQTSRKDGMISFDQVLVDLVKRRMISSSDALDNTSNKKEMENLIK